MVLPLYDHNPVRRQPYVTYLLIALNVVVFLIQPIALGSVSGDVSEVQECRQTAFFRQWGAIPKELLSNDALDETVAVQDGACFLVEPDYEKQPFVSAVTAMFLHAGWLHLLGNMLFLFVFGNNVEDRLGRLRFLLAYLAWGIVATYAFAIPDPGSTAVVVGASGAIAGVLGAYLVLFPRARIVSLVLMFIPARLPAWLVLGTWFGLQWYYSSGGTITEGGGVAYLAHVAGFVAGVVTGIFFRRRATARPVW